MKEDVKVSLVQFASESLQRERNAERMKRFAEEEAAAGAELIVFPELSNLGYIRPVAVGDAVEAADGGSFQEFARRYYEAAEPLPGPTTETLGSVARRTGTYIMLGMAHHPSVVPHSLFNSAVLIGPNGVVGWQAKVHIPLNEKHFFYPGNTAQVYPTELGHLGMMVCYDAYFPELCRVLALRGAEILCSVFVGPSISGLVEEERCRLLAYVRSRENRAFFLACNRAGTEGKYNLVGHSAVASPAGKILAFCETDQEAVLRATLVAEDLIAARSLMPIFRDRRPELYGLLSQPFEDLVEGPVETVGLPPVRELAGYLRMYEETP